MQLGKRGHPAVGLVITSPTFAIRRDSAEGRLRDYLLIRKKNISNYKHVSPEARGRCRFAPLFDDMS